MANDNLDDIIRKNTPGLQSFVRSRVSNKDDADDIVQDTFYQFLRTISIMDNPIGQVTSWLYRVAHNLIINHDKKQREDSFMDDLSEVMMASDEDDPEVQMLRTMVWDELHKAMDELPKEQREAVEMTEIRGLSIKDAAQQMGVTQGTFLSRKHYAVKHIRMRLKVLYQELTNE